MSYFYLASFELITGQAVSLQDAQTQEGQGKQIFNAKCISAQINQEISAIGESSQAVVPSGQKIWGLGGPWRKEIKIRIHGEAYTLQERQISEGRGKIVAAIEELKIIGNIISMAKGNESAGIGNITNFRIRRRKEEDEIMAWLLAA
jgi:hypothetical protein